jgi:hypothetical protein
MPPVIAQGSITIIATERMKMGIIFSAVAESAEGLPTW